MRSGPTPSARDTQGRSPTEQLLVVALSVVAAAFLAAFLAVAFDAGNLAWDLRFAYLPAAENMLGGGFLYPGIDDPILEEQKGYVYPPQLAIALAPLTALPVDLTAVLVTAALIAIVILTLRVLGVRDLRCYAASFLWMPVVSGVGFANLSIPLALALALAWRWRDGARVGAGVALGAAISSKLLLWPLLVWAVATKRALCAGVALLSGFAITLLAWAAIGFDGLREYPELLRRLTDIQAARSYSLVGIASEAGLPSWAGTTVALALGVGLLVACVAFASRGDDVRSFTCAVVSTLALSPILWLHYLVILLVPLAVARPRFSALWLLPTVLLVSPRPGYAEGVATFAPLLVALLLGALLLARPVRPARS